MNKFIKCSGCGKREKFINAIKNNWKITPLKNKMSKIIPFSYICPQCIKDLKKRVHSWINSKENREAIKKMKEQNKKYDEKCTY